MTASVVSAPPHAGALAQATAPAAADDVATVLYAEWCLEGTLHPIAGERDSNFRLETTSGRYLVKVTHPHESLAAVDAQSAVLGHLLHTDPTLPVQVPVATHTGAARVVYPPDPRRWVRVVRYLEGELRRTFPWQDGLAVQIGALAGRLDRALHRFEHPGCLQALLWDLTRASELTALLPVLGKDDVGSAVRSALDRFTSHQQMLARCPVQAIHNDLNPSNLLLANDGRQVSGVIDFGDMLVAPAVVELAVACAYLTDAPDPIGAIGDCAAAYVAEWPLAGSVIAALPDLVATRWAMTILITEWRAQLQPENAAYILRNNLASRRGLSLLDERGRARLVARLQDLTA